MSKSTPVRAAIVAAFAIGSLCSLALVSSASEGRKVVMLRDDCDPATFNAAAGPGTCVGDGKTTFADFIAQVTKHQDAPLWRFTPAALALPVSKMLELVNPGGETHTFTKVAEFGGGFIIPLNVLSGNPVPRPECTTGAVVVPGVMLQPLPEGPANVFVEAGTAEDGPTAGSAILPRQQKVKFQCCIHPWMRTEVTVP
jgi:hypothetical protein